MEPHYMRMYEPRVVHELPLNVLCHPFLRHEDLESFTTGNPHSFQEPALIGVIAHHRESLTRMR